MNISASEMSMMKTLFGGHGAKRASIGAESKAAEDKVSSVPRPKDAVSLGALSADEDESKGSGKLKGPAHGVARLLAAGHFKGATEAKLLEKFGHLVKSDDDQDAVTDLVSDLDGGADFEPMPPVLPETEVNPLDPFGTMVGGWSVTGLDVIA